MSQFLSFDRKQWARLRNSAPLTLTQDDLLSIQGINENLTIDETTDVYLPIIRLLTFYVQAHQNRNSILQRFLGTKELIPPFIIGIAGSVAVGKSTTARLLKKLLSCSNWHPKVDLVTTDGFLYPTKILEQKNLMHRKGFPQSYDINRLLKFVAQAKAGISHLQVPIYSHVSYDITDEVKIVSNPDILIIEGLNVLQQHRDQAKAGKVFVSDFLDFSIYIDAPKNTIEHWYIERFLKLRNSVFTQEGSYFKHFANLSNQEAIAKAKEVWHSINLINLEQNILPTKNQANLILHKDNNHEVDQILLRP